MHWTYNSFNNTDDLLQGDILEPTPELSDLFSEVHPHFLDAKYRNFLVLTQSCDLARRSGAKSCNATHISLSVIRSLEDVISDSFKVNFGYLAQGIYDSERKKIITQLIERIINQNENALGLFYLHPDADAGITVPSVAILRVSISVRAKEHYGKVLTARVGRLDTKFQPKLGWMVGNLYSRVGAPDWKELKSSEFEEQEVINNILKFNRPKPLWINSKIIKKIIEQYPSFETFSLDEQEEIINKLKPTPPKQVAIDRIINIIRDTRIDIKDDALEKIRLRLINDDELEAKMRKIAPQF